MSGPRGEAVPEPALSALDVADALLALAIRHPYPVLRLEGAEGEHRVVGGAGSTPTRLATMPRALGEAVAVRLALLAGLDPWGTRGQIGHLEVDVGGEPAEFFLVTSRVAEGLGVELRGMARPGDLPAALWEGDTAMPSEVGPYRLQAELGRGGMGIVYRAVTGPPERTVAVKVLHAGLARDPHLAQQFVREGRAASLANHPGIVQVVDFGSLPDGRAYLVMELVEDGTLEEALTQGAFEPRRAARLARRICAALEAAHVRGVVHRDLKPSNVFLGPADAIKIADFGAAKVESPARDVVTHVVLGTPSYMSPEQARGLATDGRTDIYSLGCMLYRMLTGRVPFVGNAEVDVLQHHVGTPVPPLESPHGPLPPALVAAVTRAMAKRPEDRFQSAGEMALALDGVLSALPLDERRGVGA